jgi:hypothetical protein
MVAVKQLSLKTSVFVVVWRFCLRGKARFSPGQNPHSVPGLLLGAAIHNSYIIQIRKNIDKKQTCQRSKVNRQSQ